MRRGRSAYHILRRSLIAGVVGTAVSEEAAAEGPEPDPHLDPHLAAQVALKAVVKAMAEIHGGIWDVHVDHVAGFILIRPCMDQLSL
jgi:hypothetical protein